MHRRDFNLRQGGVLNDDSIKRLNLIVDSESDSFPVIITHDCDLRHENEEIVELIIGRKIENPKSVYENAKNPRCLHLQFTSTSDQKPVYLELCFSNRKSVPQNDFSKLRQKESVLNISEDNHRTLKHWLASRYSRPAFPNSFEDRLRTKKGGKTVEQQIAKILKPVERHIRGVFFNLGEHRNVELSESVPYILVITIVYVDESGSTTARKESKNAAQQIESLFLDVYGAAEVATKINLEACNPISESHMPLSVLRKVDQWRLEYLSIERGSSGDFLQATEIPG